MNNLSAEEQAIEAKVLALILQGNSQNKIAKELKVSRHQIMKICNSEAFRAALKSEGDRMLSLVREKFKTKMGELEPLAFEALKHNLSEKKIEGVKLYVQLAGLLHEEKAIEQDSSFTVIMPGAKIENVIEASSQMIVEDIDYAEATESKTTSN